MKNSDNDNETFQPIGLAAARLVERCEQKHEDGERQTGRCGTDEDKTDSDSGDIDRELEEIRTRIQWINWMEFVLNKRSRFNSAQVGGRRYPREEG